MSSLIENFENAFNTYTTAWKEEPIKMAAGHLTAAAVIGAGVYYRKDISQATSNCINNVQSLITSSKTFNNLSAFANTAKDAALTKLNVAKDVTSSFVSSAKDAALTKLNVAKDVTSSFVSSAKDTTVTNLNIVKDVTISSANIVKDVTISSTNNAKDATIAIVKDTAANLSTKKEVFLTGTSNAWASMNVAARGIADSVKSKFM